MEESRVDLRGVKVYPFTDPQALIDFADRRKGILVAVNAEKIANANERTRAIINSNIGYCDGVGAVMAARGKGAKAEKIAGCELWLKIIDRFHASGRSFYIIGATPEVHAATIVKLSATYPGINIVGHRDGYLKTDGERAALIDDVADKKPDFVFVAMGSPTQELLMSDMQKRHQAVYQGLGGSFDVFTGNVPRAPKWWLDHNLEFAYRLLRQPKRIRRNLVYFKFAWWLVAHRF
ncbi:MAG: WecB/TagA/CpsF family glycosyltransferase [Muribaculaceae bacterium]|nr:WecB/TagA/CpsF family glycosyltransferase [Muribaculaceae bacterium]